MTMNQDHHLPIQHQLDTRGLTCPEPIMMLHRVIRKAQSGEKIQLVATDPSTTWDIPKFCLHLGHTLISQHELSQEQGTEYQYIIQKG